PSFHTAAPRTTATGRWGAFSTSWRRPRPASRVQIRGANTHATIPPSAIQAPTCYRLSHILLSFTPCTHPVTVYVVSGHGLSPPPKMLDHLETRLWRTRTVAPCPVPVMTKCGAGGLGREFTSARRVPNQDESRSTSAVASSGRIRSPVPQSHTRWILVTGAARRASRKSRRVAPNLLSISMRAGACQSPLRMTGPPLELITIGEEGEVPAVCP